MPLIQSPALLNLTVAALVAYILGSLPFAYGVSRSRGVNIFDVGSGQAGTTNVYRHVGPRYAAIVFFGDIAKGALAILLGSWLGLAGAWLLVPALATTMGHWNSMFTGFKGGDGVATGVGIALVLAPFAVAIPMAIAAFVLWRWHRTSHPTLWGGLAGFAAFLAVSQAQWAGVDAGVVAGITVICAAILLHSLVYHRRRAARAGVMSVLARADSAGNEDPGSEDGELIEERQR